MLKDDIKLHLFASHPPCGFFAKKKRHSLESHTLCNAVQ